MTQEDLQEIKQNALVLRNMATKVLEGIERLEREEAALTSSSKNGEQLRAAIVSGILSGKRKPVVTPQLTH